MFDEQVGQNIIKIETYWNVNISEMNKEQLMRFIKIETYWNVNLAIVHFLCSPFHIKIETYWNVNIVMSGRSSTEVSN